MREPDWYNLTKMWMFIAVGSVSLILLTRWWWIATITFISLMALTGQIHNLKREEEKQIEEDIEDVWGMKVGDRE